MLSFTAYILALGSNQEKLVALAFLLSQFNGNSFDKASNSCTMKTCVQRLSLDSIQELLRLILTSYTKTATESLSQEETRGVSGIMSLFVYISKSCDESIRREVQELVLAVMFHLSFGGSNSSALEKLDKKCKKHKKKSSEFDLYIINNSKFLRTVLSIESNFSKEEKALSRPLFIGFCSDLLSDAQPLISDKIWRSLCALSKIYSVNSDNEGMNEIDIQISKSLMLLTSECSNNSDNKLRCKYANACIAVVIIAYLHFICDDNADSEVK